jgi:hypothetical protein
MAERGVIIVVYAKVGGNAGSLFSPNMTPCLARGAIGRRACRRDVSRPLRQRNLAILLRGRDPAADWRCGGLSAQNRFGHQEAEGVSFVLRPAGPEDTAVSAPISSNN